MVDKIDEEEIKEWATTNINNDTNEGVRNVINLWKEREKRIKQTKDINAVNQVLEVVNMMHDIDLMLELWEIMIDIKIDENPNYKYIILFKKIYLTLASIYKIDVKNLESLEENERKEFIANWNNLIDTMKNDEKLNILLSLIWKNHVRDTILNVVFSSFTYDEQKVLQRLEQEWTEEASDILLQALLWTSWVMNNVMRQVYAIKFERCLKKINSEGFSLYSWTATIISKKGNISSDDDLLSYRPWDEKTKKEETITEKNNFTSIFDLSSEEPPYLEYQESQKKLDS